MSGQVSGSDGPACAPAQLTVRLDALVAVCLLTLVAGLTCGLGWRWLALATMDVSSTLSSLESPALVLNTVLPVVGNGIGYFASYRRVSRRSLPMFVVPGVLLSGVGLTVSLTHLPASPEPCTVAVTVVATLISPVLVLAVLLTRRDLLRVRSGLVTQVGRP